MMSRRRRPSLPPPPPLLSLLLLALFALAAAARPSVGTIADESSSIIEINLGRIDGAGGEFFLCLLGCGAVGAPCFRRRPRHRQKKC